VTPLSFVAVSVVAFVFAFVGSLPLAGPIALLVVSNGAGGHYKEALRIALGAAVADERRVRARICHTCPLFADELSLAPRAQPRTGSRGVRPLRSDGQREQSAFVLQFVMRSSESRTFSHRSPRTSARHLSSCARSIPFGHAEVVSEFIASPRSCVMHPSRLT
jgi:hypothetical protein